MVQPQELTTRSLWVELPSTQVKVVARISGTYELGAIETVLLRLLRRERTEEQLATLIGNVPPVVVVSALERLAELDLVQEVSGAARGWVTVKEPPERLDEPVAGWIALAPHQSSVAIPELLPASEKQSVKDFDGGHPRVPWEGSDGHPPVPPDVADILRAAVRSGAHWAGEPRKEDADPERIVSLLLERERPRGPPIGRKRTCWALVELVPSVSGSVTVVMHEPTLIPRLDAPSPVSRVLEPWLRQNAHSTWSRIEEEKRRLMQSSSVVLQAAGIRSLEELAKSVRELRAAWCDRLRAQPWWGAFGAEVDARIFEQQRWLVITTQAPTFAPQCLDAAGHAIERLCRELADGARPALDAWAERFKKLGREGRDRECERWKSPSEFAAALASTLGPRSLGESESHLRRSLGRLTELQEQLRRPLGAGSAFAAFLLPLFLGLPEERSAFAARLARALKREPELLNLMDALIELRNSTAHARDQVPMTVERADELMARVTCALATAGVPTPEVKA